MRPAQTYLRCRSRKLRQRGQSLLESALILVLASFILFGMLQMVLIMQGWQVEQWAGFAASRSRVVGFNDVVVQKAWYVGNILNSGKMLAPATGLNAIQQVQLEEDSIPLFLQSIDRADQLSPQLDYQGWEGLGNIAAPTVNDMYTGSGKQDFPLFIAGMIPMLGGSLGTTNIVLETNVQMENHFPLYLQVD